MLTFIGKYGLTCITKEDADRLTQGIEKNVAVNYLGHTVKIEGSIGDDFEEIIDDIKRKEFPMSKNNGGSWGKWHVGNFSNLKFFHVASLTRDEQRKLDSKDSTFKQQFTNGIPDFSKPQKLLFQTQTKYRLSLCTRRTFLIKNCEQSCKSVFKWKCRRKKCKACRCKNGCTKQKDFY